VNIRLQKLRKELHLQWGELAEKLGVSRSMLDQVRKGVRNFGPKTERKLHDLEVDAGIAKVKPVLLFENSDSHISANFDDQATCKTCAGVFLEAIDRLDECQRQQQAELTRLRKEIKKLIGGG
jgi:transcriptional regulator with XRE-family HTH domain